MDDKAYDIAYSALFEDGDYSSGTFEDYLIEPYDPWGDGYDPGPLYEGVTEW